MSFKSWINRRRILSKILGFIGIHFPEDKKDLVHFSPSFARFIGFCLLLLIIILIGFVKFSTSPYFCGTCHIMKPYYKAWKESKHNFVACVDCHYPPGFTEELRGKFTASAQVVKYVTRTYSTKPYAEIEDSSCLRKGCHAKRVLEGKATFRKGIIFDHKPHLTELRRGRKLRCTTCHSQIVVGSHIAVTESVCFTCHFKPESNGSKSPYAECTICHEPPGSDIELSGIIYNYKDFVGRGVSCESCHFDVIQGKGEVPKEMCLTCHGEPEKMEMYDDHQFIHDNHVTRHKVECFHCHTEIKHNVTTKVEFIKTDCSACHSAMHDAQKKLYMGEGGRGIEDMPSSMFLARVDCTGCHMPSIEPQVDSHFSGFTTKATEASCLSCHGKEYKGVLEDWKKMITASLDGLKQRLDGASRILTGSQSHRNYEQAQKHFEDARFNYELVKFGNGVHNVEYADTLLYQAKKDLEKAGELLLK